jgi:hypothetical protein
MIKLTKSEIAALKKIKAKLPPLFLDSQEVKGYDKAADSANFVLEFLRTRGVTSPVDEDWTDVFGFSSINMHIDDTGRANKKKFTLMIPIAGRGELAFYKGKEIKVGFFKQDALIFSDRLPHSFVGGKCVAILSYISEKDAEFLLAAAKYPLD